MLHLRTFFAALRQKHCTSSITAIYSDCYEFEKWRCTQSGGVARAGPRVRPLDGGRGGWLGGLYSPQPPAPAYPPPGVFQINGRIFIKVMADGTFASSVAGVVSVAWDYSPCRRRYCVQVWFSWRGIIRHAGGEIVCTCGARVYGICPLKSTICITYCPASCYVYYYPVFMSRVDMIIATILPFV